MKTLARVLAVGCALLLLLGPAGGRALQQAAAAEPEVKTAARDAFEQDYPGGHVRLEARLAVSGQLSPGHQVMIDLYLDSSITGAEKYRDPQAALLNGVIYVALPPGLDAAGKLRLYYLDEGSGSYAVAYSRDYSMEPRMDGHTKAQRDAAGADPKLILAAMDELNKSFDPEVQTTGPTDPRLQGGDSHYSVAGLSWLQPADAQFRALVDPFEPKSSRFKRTQLKVSIPVKVTAPSMGQPVLLYIGGLSLGAAATDIPGNKMPPNALPLGALPPREEAGSSDSTAGKDEAQTKKDKKAKAKKDKKANKPVPAILYGARWARWELALTLEDLLKKSAAGSDSTLTDLPGLSQPDSGASEDSSAGDDAATGSGADDTDNGSIDHSGFIDDSPDGSADSTDSAAAADVETVETGDSGPTSLDDLRSAILNRDENPPAEAPEDDSDVATVDMTGNAADSAGDPLETDSEAGADPGESREVQPGTLHSSPGEMVSVALKPISGFDPAHYDAGTTQGSPGGLAAASRYPGSGSFSGGAALSEMLLIPGGEFLMGTLDKQLGDKDEKPQHKVNLPDYYIDKYPVTNRQFYSFVLAAGYKPEGNWDKYYSPETADLPVLAVSWADATAFARWAGKRLPTEAEWEKACRGTDGRTYPWGEEWSSSILPRSDDNIFEVVGARANVSPYGCVDMVGVIWQWTASSYTDSYPYDPKAGGDKKVLRGGTYSNGRNIVRCANRYSESPNVALATFGFRCARDAK